MNVASCVRRKSFLVATKLLLAATLTPTPVFAFLRGAERIEGRANLITGAISQTIHLRKNREARGTSQTLHHQKLTSPKDTPPHHTPRKHTVLQ